MSKNKLKELEKQYEEMSKPFKAVSKRLSKFKKLTWETESIVVNEDSDYRFQDHLDEIKTIEKINK
jgi:archaellum component FlaC|tara:strand:+ start:144 stop:341 length:198 start_codon:yes stop_codon:yes gene_type:complete